MGVIVTTIDMPESCLQCVEFLRGDPVTGEKLYCHWTWEDVTDNFHNKTIHSECPLKSVSELLTKIKRHKQLADGKFPYDFIAYNKGLYDSMEVIKEYCKVE